MELQALKAMATQVRRDIVRMVHGVQSGHPGGSLGCTDYVVALFFEVMNHNPNFSMEAKGEDVFFLSNGHISPLLYSVLARSGYFPVEELATFRKIDSRLQGHPTTHEGLPGVRIASGSLGQGLSVASGTATAKKIDGDNGLVFALTGDGELQEGQNWEAIMFAAHRKLDNLIIAVDYNGQQSDGPTEHGMGLGDLKAKMEAFGWAVLQCPKGNDMETILASLAEAKALVGQGKPICILLHTDMGAGVSFMAGTHEWHGIAPNDAQLEQALSELPTELQDY